MNLLPFQITASNQIVNKFNEYMVNPLMRDRKTPVPFYQNLTAITGAGKTLILADAVEQMRLQLPIEPIVLWLSKGKIVVAQTYTNLSNGKYTDLLTGYSVKYLLDTNKGDITDSSQGLILIATVGKFNQKDMEQGDRHIFQAELDKAEKSLWDMIKIRLNGKGEKRQLFIVYDEGHNLSDQQTNLLLALAPDALIAASATLRVPEALSKLVVDRLKNERGWIDKDFSTVVRSSDVVNASLIKKNIVLGGYQTPMETAVTSLLEDFRKVEGNAKTLGLDFRPKAIYVSNTNMVMQEADNIHTPFSDRKARPIEIWRHLVSSGIDPNDIAVYCNLKFDSKYPKPSQFVLFSGGDDDYDKFIDGNYHHIIFNLALQEGWDDPECYFAYIDKDMGSKDQVTQIVGRVLRQPGAKHYSDHSLNTANFYVRTDEKHVFEEIIEDVRKKIISDIPDISLSFYSAGKGSQKPVISPRKDKTVPNVSIDCTNAKAPIGKIISNIIDYRKDEINTVGAGGHIQVLQKIGDGAFAKEEWIDTEHSNKVSARWIFVRELQKYCAKAVNVCEIEDPKFDAFVEYNSNAAQNIRETAEKVIDAYIEYSSIVQNPYDQIPVGDIAADPSQMTLFKYSIHEGYSDLNSFEKEFAAAIDQTKKVWFRNPSRGVFEIPLLDKGGTNNFFPDFIVWSDGDIYAIDTKGDHLIKEDSARKLFYIEKVGAKSGPNLFVRLITKGKWGPNTMKEGPEGYTVWVQKLGKASPIHVSNLDQAVQASLSKF